MNVQSLVCVMSTHSLCYLQFVVTNLVDPLRTCLASLRSGGPNLEDSTRIVHIYIYTYIYEPFLQVRRPPPWVWSPLPPSKSLNPDDARKNDLDKLSIDLDRLPSVRLSAAH